MNDMSVLYSLLFGIIVLALVRKRKRPSLPYPPGPNGHPILGNALDLTTGIPIWEAPQSPRYALKSLRS